ncbi:MAG TPA: hypothetical protein VFD17_04425 [Clostridia bacterium]|nr:hypothetical protein [Clostridia bacterium]
MLSVNGVCMAPFETFEEHGNRARSETPYNDEFIKRCRKEALRYSEMSDFLGPPNLKALVPCIPFHYRKIVFEGIEIKGEGILA